MDRILIKKKSDMNLKKKADQQPWIDGAQYVSTIESDGEDVTYVWRGGSIVNVYNTKGEKIDFFPVGDESSEQEPTQPEIETAITNHMDELMSMSVSAGLKKKAESRGGLIRTKEQISGISIYAQHEFWAEVIKHLPEITTGEMDPSDADEFKNACDKAVADWIWANQGQSYGASNLKKKSEY